MTIAAISAALSRSYRVERELGAGGMATVYLAQDLKHDRKVAIKVLRPELAAVIGAERFLSEIKTTANLQHPHILPLHDSGAAQSFLYYVMPFIEGESLRDRLNREKQLPVQDAIRIATEVAGALDYAHRHGVIHRDIKPENILLHDGRALVADFGIALAASKAGGTRMTETGMSLGTPHYMSPEQAMGEREITARSDVYALGAITYELLLGEPPFTGPTAQAIVAKVMTAHPASVTGQRKTVPPHVEAAVFTALEKLPADRFATAAEFAAALADESRTRSTIRSPIAASAAATSRGHRRTTIGALVLAVVSLAFALGGWFRSQPPGPVRRYSMGFPAGQSIRGNLFGVNIALSPDGSRMVYVGPGESGGELWVRERSQLEAVRLSGTAGATNPTFSPDGKFIAYSAGSTFDLRIIPAGGGPTITLAKPGAGSGGGIDWGPDGWIYYDSPSGLSRVSATGGTPEVLLPLAAADGELGHAWPDVLPNGKAVLLRSRTTLEAEDFDLLAVEIPSGQRHVLTKGLLARYVAPGRIVYLRADGVLLVAPFDSDRLALTGPGVPLVEGIATKALGAADIALSDAGTLAYIPGSPSLEDGVAELVWVERNGTVVTTAAGEKFTPSINRAISLSPNGTQLALDVVSGGSVQIRVKQLPEGPFTRLTFEGSNNYRPVWTADGQSVVYISNRDGIATVWRQRANGATAAQQVHRGPSAGIHEAQLTPDGSWLVYRASPEANRSIFAVRTRGDSVPVPILNSRFDEDGIALSPDGRWLAYASNESGRYEIYVRPFPDVATGRWQISTNGGTAARWAHSGRELFYQSLANEMMVTEIRPGTGFQPGNPRRLFLQRGDIAPSLVVPSFDLSPDDRRFLMVRLAQAGQVAGEGQLVVVDNWLSELAQKIDR